MIKGLRQKLMKMDIEERATNIMEIKAMLDEVQAETMASIERALSIFNANVVVNAPVVPKAENAIVLPVEETKTEEVKVEVEKPKTETTVEVKETQEVEELLNTRVIGTEIVTKLQVPQDSNLVEVYQRGDVLTGYYMEGTKRVPFCGGVGHNKPIVFNNMALQDKVGNALVEAGFAKTFDPKVIVETVPVTIDKKERSMVIYKDQTGAYLGAVDNMFTFFLTPGYSVACITKMDKFIKDAGHITGEDRVTGYATPKTYKGKTGRDLGKLYTAEVSAAISKYVADSKKLEEALFSATENVVETDVVDNSATNDPLASLFSNIEIPTSTLYAGQNDEMDKLWQSAEAGC